MPEPPVSFHTAWILAGLAGTEPVVADRDGDVDRLLAEHRPELLIDAAGPFQGSGYQVPLACARASVPYLDLADARAFVTGIASLDEAARECGVAIIAGASSVPALSGAVARRLADGLDAVRAVEISISASNRATSGTSVAAAILSYVGRPIRLWRGRRRTRGWGWQDLRRETFAIEGMPALKGRWLALADVPDHDLMPDMLTGRPAVTFRAGTDIALQTLGLWLLSWPVRWFPVAALARLAFIVPPLQRLMRFLGSDRSVMSVVLKGLSGGRGIERRWTLIADEGDGPEIPTLAAVLLAEAILAGTMAPGARDAGRLLDLEQFEPLFASLSVRHRTVETRLPPPLYERVMGPRYAALPEAVREVGRFLAKFVLPTKTLPLAESSREQSVINELIDDRCAVVTVRVAAVHLEAFAFSPSAAGSCCRNSSDACAFFPCAPP